MTCPTTIGTEQHPLANAVEFPSMLDEAWTFEDRSGVGNYDEFVIDGGPLRTNAEAFSTDALLMFDAAGESLTATSDCIFFDGGMLAASDQPETIFGGLFFFINTQTLALSSGTLPATAIVGDGETLYLATPSVLGTLEDPIEPTATPYVQTGKMALSAGMTCNVPRAYPRIQTAGDLELISTADVRGTERTATMEIHGRSGDYEQERTVNLPRGTEAPAWSVRIGSKAGEAEPWSISALTVRTDREQKVR
jgi:hypothetical protein